MNELTKRETQLPETIEDLTQFVLVSKAKLQAYMLKLQTVNKLSVAQEIRDQTLQEAQEVSNALIAAEQRIGELLLALPTAQGKRTDKETSAEGAAKVQTKAEAIAEQGYERHEAQDFQTMAKYPEVVKKVLEDAIAEGKVATKSSVMSEIKFYKDRVKELSEENKELRNKEPEIRTVEKKIEVTPPDYDSIKRDYKRVSAERKEAIERAKTAESRVKELENRTSEVALQVKLENEADAFCVRVAEFIRATGGYIWITERLADLPEEKRKLFVSGVKNINAWSSQMLTNIGGENGK